MKLQVWNLINFSRLDKYDVKTSEEGIILIDQLADAQLKNSEITDNSFDLMIYNERTQEWETWFDEDGNDASYYEVVNGKVILNEYGNI